MIFVTTGTQAPFNRLVKFIDSIALSLNDRVVVQASGVDFPVNNIEVFSFLSPEEFDSVFNKASLIISHAGMGSIISALTIAKPIIIVPRLASLGEHRNDHQMGTAKKMEHLGYVPVIYDLEGELLTAVQTMLMGSAESSENRIGKFASVSLVKSIKDFMLK